MQTNWYASIWSKFDLLSEYTATHWPTYTSGGMGIGSKDLYGPFSNKAWFIFEHLSRAQHDGRLPSQPIVCEVGFNAGHSAMLFLDTLPNAIVHEWDLGERYGPKNAQLLTRVYPGRFHYHAGDSARTLPAFVKENPDVMCDVLFIDGAKGLVRRYHDVLLFGQIAKPGALIFGDEANSKQCMSGQVDEQDALCAAGAEQTEHAWNRLVRSNVLTYEACSAPGQNQKNERDIVCAWRYASRTEAEIKSALEASTEALRQAEIRHRGKGERFKFLRGRRYL